ncbi:MAG: hypothetical protein ACTSYA_10490 [Candidatus Kariarchaeaceae archaeon]
MSEIEKQYSDEELMEMIVNHLETKSFKPKILSLLKNDDIKIDQEKDNYQDYQRTQKNHPSKFLLLQNGDIILVADSLEELWDQLPQNPIGKYIIIVPRKLIQLGRAHLGWPIKKKKHK